MTQSAFIRPPVPAIVSQHVEEAAHLRHVRTVLVRAPHVKLHQLGRLDERIAAHLDGIAVAGDAGLQRCAEALERAGCGEVFALAVRALELRDAHRLLNLFDIASSEPAAARGLSSALGWVSASVLQGIVSALLAAPRPFMRAVGLQACVMHRVDPGPALRPALDDDDAMLRERACRVAAAAGRIDMLPALNAMARSGGNATADGPAAPPAVVLAADHAAVLLGSRGEALERLLETACSADGGADAAAELALRVTALPSAHAHLQRLAAASETAVGAQAIATRRRMIRRCGIVGDPQHVPWLIQQMDDLRWSRLAGEACTLITGADLAALDLERKPPTEAGDGRLGGPSEDPLDDDVALDEDESLPWPDPQRVQDWWTRHATEFPPGTRHFMGAPLTVAHVQTVLRTGCQRQRVAAALWNCALAPGTPLFRTSAPAWRQTRWLGRH